MNKQRLRFNFYIITVGFYINYIYKKNNQYQMCQLLKLLFRDIYCSNE